MRTAFPALLIAGLALACTGPELREPAPGERPDLRIFLARRILTMDDARPEARAVAVANGRILSVGSERELRRQYAGRVVHVDRQFEDHVLLPGFVDNHLHPTMAALLLPMEFVTPYDWELPGRHVEGVRGREAYLARLKQLDGAFADPDRWLFAWGYHPIFHGEISRADLDAISKTRPIVAWHRSFHELYANTAALQRMGLEADDFEGHPHIDFAEGHFFETGLEPAFLSLAPVLMDAERFRRGLARVRDVVHRGGITTIADMATGLFDLETEWRTYREVLENDATPFRVLLIPDARIIGAMVGLDGALTVIETFTARNTHRLQFVRQVKLFADGAFYSQLMQMGEPGYLDGHHGEWLMPPAALEAAARHWWKAGYQIHVHVNGDLGVQVVLDVLEKLQKEEPKQDHRFTLHHFGYSTEAQSARIADLGALVSANPFYLYALGDAYSKVGLGPERARHMVRLGSLARAGVPISLHSDFTMAPADPLLLASVAVNRRTANGELMAPDERLSIEQALRAITIDAAYAIQMEDEVGSITPGKKADFTVLEADPTRVPPEALGDVGIWGTVFEGELYPIR